MKLGRPPLLAIAPLILALLLGAGWSYFWLRASDHAATLFADWRAEQARQGTVVACANERRGGYPFQFNFTCSNPTLSTATSDGPAKIEGRELRLVALVYDPTRFIAELDGPVIATRENYEAELAWASARMSVRVTADPRRPEWRQSDVLIRDANLTVSEYGRARGVYSAEETEIHLRRSPGRLASIDAAFSAQRPELRIARADPLRLDSAEMITRLDNIPPSGPGGFPEWLMRWQANDGVAELIGLRLAAGEALSRTRGTLSLDARGYPQGTVSITNADVDPNALPDRDPLGVAQFAAATVSAVGVPADIEGRKGRQVTLRLERGRIHLGPMALMPLPKLF